MSMCHSKGAALQSLFVSGHVFVNCEVNFNQTLEILLKGKCEFGAFQLSTAVMEQIN